MNKKIFDFWELRLNLCVSQPKENIRVEWIIYKYPQSLKESIDENETIIENGPVVFKSN